MIKKFVLLVVWLLLIWAIAYPFVYETTPSQSVKSEEQKPGARSTQAKQRPEEPLHDVDLPDFAAIKDVKQKKKQFFDFIRKPVEQANSRLRQQRATLKIALMMTQAEEPLSDIQTEQVHEIFTEFDISEEQISEVSLTQALRRVDIVPKELVMMQAANESAWGTSRFARIGLNFFGQWCFSKGCGMVPRARNSGAQHEVAAFDSVKEAVDAYFHNINTNGAYRELRDIRADLRAQEEPVTARALSYGLMAYSERGEAYIEELQAMMNHNEAYFEE